MPIKHELNRLEKRLGRQEDAGPSYRRDVAGLIALHQGGVWRLERDSYGALVDAALRRAAGEPAADGDALVYEDYARGSGRNLIKGLETSVGRTVELDELLGDVTVWEHAIQQLYPEEAGKPLDEFAPAHLWLLLTGVYVVDRWADEH